MKRIFVSLIAVLLVLTFVGKSCFADEYRIEREAQYQKRIMEIGFRILNANEIKQRMTFRYAPEKVVNASAYATSKLIVVYKGLIPYVDSDDELAGILSHEIAHGVDFSNGYWNRIFMMSAVKNYEIKADKKAVDYMVNAGYNPVAFIVVMNKISAEPNWYEKSQTHPEGSLRLNYIYEYIYTKYPEYLANNEYKNNIYYQNFLMVSEDFRKKVKTKYSNNLINVNNKSAK